VLGAASVTFAAQINSWLQLAVEPRMRGRVMALYSIVFLGSTPIGGPIAGWLAEAVDPRATLVMAAGAALVAAVAGRVAFARLGVPATPAVEPIPDAVIALRPRRRGEGCDDEGRRRRFRPREQARAALRRRTGSRTP